MYKISILSLLLFTYNVAAASLDSDSFRTEILPKLSSSCSTSIQGKTKKFFPDKTEDIKPINNVSFVCSEESLKIKEGYDGKLFFTYNNGYEDRTFVYRGRLESKGKNKVNIKFYDGFKNINDDIDNSTSSGFSITNIKPE